MTNISLINDYLLKVKRS